MSDREEATAREWNARFRKHPGVGPGWVPIVTYLIDLCDFHGIKVAQIKEKLGGLRFYTDAVPDGKWDLIRTAIGAGEVYASRICEDCGSRENVRLRNDLSWIRTLCLKCYKECTEKHDLRILEETKTSKYKLELRCRECRKALELEVEDFHEASRELAIKGWRARSKHWNYRVWCPDHVRSSDQEPDVPSGS